MLELHEIKVLNPKPKCWATGEAAWQLSGFRPVAIQKVHCVNVGKFCPTSITKYLINIRALWLFLPWAFCVFIRALHLHFLIIWLLFWHTDFLWMTTSSLRVWEWVAVFSCNLVGENVCIFMPVFTIAFSYAWSNILWAGFKWSERQKG